MIKIWHKAYDPGVPTEINPNEYSSINDMLEVGFSKFKDNPAFHNMGTTLTYKEVEVLSRKFASFLQSDLQLKKGDRVALMMPNVLQYPIALFGVLRAGMIAVNVNPLYTARELEHQLRDAGVQTIVIFANSANVLQKALASTQVKNIIVTEIGDMLKFPKNYIVNFVIKHVKKMIPDYNLPNVLSFKECLNKGKENAFKKPDVKLDDIAFLQYTGGTTGVAKGAVLTHKNIVPNMVQARAGIKDVITDGQEIIITPLPLYHCLLYT